MHLCLNWGSCSKRAAREILLQWCDMPAFLSNTHTRSAEHPRQACQAIILILSKRNGQSYVRCSQPKSMARCICRHQLWQLESGLNNGRLQPPESGDMNNFGVAHKRSIHVPVSCVMHLCLNWGSCSKRAAREILLQLCTNSGTECYME